MCVNFYFLYICSQVLFKFDDSGKGKLVDIDQLGKANKGLVVSIYRHMTDT